MDRQVRVSLVQWFYEDVSIHGFAILWRLRFTDVTTIILADSFLFKE
jgi:hypothetical protein